MVGCSPQIVNPKRYSHATFALGNLKAEPNDDLVHKTLAQSPVTAGAVLGSRERWNTRNAHNPNGRIPGFICKKAKTALLWQTCPASILL